MSDEEKEKARKLATKKRARTMQMISSLQGQLNDLNAQKQELEKKLNEIEEFTSIFNTQFESCKSGFESIGSCVANLKYDHSSIDTSLKKLTSINNGIGKITSKTTETMDSKKAAIDKKTKTKKQEIEDKIDELTKRINNIESQISSLRASIGAI